MAILEDDFSDEAFLDTAARHSASAWIRDIHKTLASYMLIMHRDYRRARDFATCETPIKIAYLNMLTGFAWWREGNGVEAERAWQARWLCDRLGIAA